MSLLSEIIPSASASAADICRAPCLSCPASSALYAVRSFCRFFSLNMLPVRYLLIPLLSIRAVLPTASLWDSIVLVSLPMGSSMVSKLLFGASFFRLSSVGSSILTLILSAKYPTMLISSSDAPGMVFTWIYPLNLYFVLRRYRVSHILCIVYVGSLSTPELRNNPSI